MPPAHRAQPGDRARRQRITVSIHFGRRLGLNEAASAKNDEKRCCACWICRIHDDSPSRCCFTPRLAVSGSILRARKSKEAARSSKQLQFYYFSRFNALFAASVADDLACVLAESRLCNSALLSARRLAASNCLMRLEIEQNFNRQNDAKPFSWRAVVLMNSEGQARNRFFDYGHSLP
jgi:hypothetical protein